MKTIFAAATAAMVCSAATADVYAIFVEGAPKDRFVLTNVGACDLDAVQLTVDLANSASGVIFDVTGSGAGVQVFQPFEIIAGSGFVTGAPKVADGDRSVTLELNGFPMGETVAFTIDVDDTLGGREITVSDSEIRGATASVQTASWTASAAFGEKAEARVALPACS